MDAMPRPRPPHLQREGPRWYVRKGKGRRVRIRAEFGTPEFEIEYQAAISGAVKPTLYAPAVNSLGWLIARYRETAVWNTLSPATRRQRENIFLHVVELSGHLPFARIDRQALIKGRERRAHTPAQARNFLDAMRGVFKWAAGAGLVKDDPTLGVSNPPRKHGDGFRPWTERDVEAYQRRWPVGTRQRVWLDVLLYTGLRRGDAVRLGKQHVRDGIAQIKTEKSKFQIAVTLPILPVLKITLDAGPCGDLSYICGVNRKPLAKAAFGNLFRIACRAAAVPGSAHGVRKIAATTAANNGATVAQLKALFGWTSDAMASLYTKSADREKLARESISKLENDSRTSIPSSDDAVRAGAGKTK